MISLNSSKVTSGVQILHLGPVWYHGFMVSKHGATGGVTLTVADSSDTAVVGSTILDHAPISSISGASIDTVKAVYTNTVQAVGRKCTNGLWCQCEGFSAGVTCSVFWS